MLKNDLFKLVIYARQDIKLPPISKEEYITAISSLEARGYVISYGNNIEIIKEYKGGAL